MTSSTQLAANQLSRMRGMNRFYHERFFSDVRSTTVAVIALFVVGFWDVPLAFLLIPPVALLGAAQTAFDASYLIFSRHYSESLETYLNRLAGEPILIAHELEDSYLFPLNDKKIVTAAFGHSFSWFGFMTLFYTALGVLAFGFGLALGWPHLTAAGSGWVAAYTVTLGALSVGALGTGWWWFVHGTGERRLAAVLDE
ncbi:MAG: hypothetical protein ACN4GZ_16575, partial [Acidimicrobiales bacterium]